MPNLREVSCGAGHQLHQLGGADSNASGDDMNALSCRVMAKIQPECRPRFCFAHQGGAVRHREADVQVVPVLRLADRADRWKIPSAGQPALGDQLVAIEQARKAAPPRRALTAYSPRLKNSMARRVLAALRTRRRTRGSMCAGRLPSLRARSGGRRRAGCRSRLLASFCTARSAPCCSRLCQLQAACPPIAPAAGGGEIPAASRVSA